MRPRKFWFLVLVLVAILVTYFANSYAQSVDYNKTGKCGNNEVDIEADEQCDNIEDDKCPSRCNNKICMCFPTSEKRSKDESPTRQFYFFDRITENETGTAEYDKLGVGFTGAKFTVNGTQKEFRIIIDTNMSWPAKLKTIDGAKAYQIFKITLYNVTDSNITSTSISFKARKLWLLENNFTAHDVTLRKHSDNYLQYHFDWATLPTTLIGEDDFYYSYTVNNSGFSFFAIVAEKPAICGNLVCERGEDFSNCCTDCGCRVNQFCKNNVCTDIKCGDNFCDVTNGESQTNCCADCGCPGGQACEFNVCQLIIRCGNNVCEEGETALTCVNDCGKKAFFSPIFILLIISLLLIFFGGMIGFKKGAKPMRKVTTTMLSKFGSEEEQIRETIKYLVGKFSANEIKEKLISEGWSKQLVEKLLFEFKPEFEPVVPDKFNLDVYVSEGLKSKPLHAIRAELLAKGWPAKTVDATLRRIVLLDLAKKYELHTEPKNKDKFAEFVKACKALNCQPNEIKEIFIKLNWSQNLIDRALKQIFK